MDNRKKKIIDIIVKVVLIIIIIILLIHNCVLSRKNNDERQTTGNVEIIEIVCEVEGTCEEEKHDNGNKENNNNNGNNNGNNNQGTQEDEPGLIVYDKKVTWKGNTEAKIFANSMYTFKDKIAPETSNTYKFVVKNSTKYNLKYNVEFIETNPHNINMKYKLKKNNTYLIDHYVSASELNISDILLNANSNDTFYLEWKWISSSNDTEVGEIAANYGLKIDIKAESVDE